MLIYSITRNNPLFSHFTPFYTRPGRIMPHRQNKRAKRPYFRPFSSLTQKRINPHAGHTPTPKGSNFGSRLKTRSKFRVFLRFSNSYSYSRKVLRNTHFSTLVKSFPLWCTRAPSCHGAVFAVHFAHKRPFLSQTTRLFSGFYAFSRIFTPTPPMLSSHPDPAHFRKLFFIFFQSLSHLFL